MSDLGRAALAYAERGIPVFPCRGKVPVAAHWQHTSLDLEQVRRWWREMPNANIGFIPASAGLLALDIDSLAAEQVAMRLGAFTEPAPSVATGRRALPPSDPKYFARAQHRYYRAPTDLEFTRHMLHAVLDVRRAGCQNLLPPSIHPESGAEYAWEDRAPAGDLPPALLEALCAKVVAGRGPGRSVAERLSVGGRHPALLSYAGALRRVGAPASHILAALSAINRECCDPPHEAAKIRELAEDVAKRYEPAVALSAAAVRAEYLRAPV
jgi:hypothetical protein